MLNPFPQLLDFGFLAPTLLRIAVAITFLYLARTHFKNRKYVANELSTFNHSTAIWVTGVLVTVEAVVGFLLFIGYYTQLVALIGFAIQLNLFFLRRNLRHVAPFSRSTYILLSIICASLLLTGAGAFAFDLPL